MKRLLSIASTLLLASCAYALEGSMQEITFETPGAKDAVCYLHEEGVKRTIRPPQTISVHRTGKELMVECMAPGNREQTAYIAPRTLDATFLNIGNAVAPGVAVDYATGGMFMYPDLVHIDFTGMRPKPNSLPSYHNDDILPPMTSGLEEFRPFHPALSEDANYIRPALRKRNAAPEESPAGSVNESVESPPQPDPTAGQAKADELTEKYNPWVFKRDDVDPGTPYYDPPGGTTVFPPRTPSESGPPVELYPIK